MAGFWESAFFMAGFRESVLLEPASGVGPFGAGFLESAVGIAGRGKAALCFVCLKA